MTPPAAVATKLADLRAVPLGEMAALAPAALDEVVRRVLPPVPVIATESTPFSFGSAI